MSKLWEPGDRIEHWLVLERFLGGWGVVYVLRDMRSTEGSARPAIVAGKAIRPEWAAEKSWVEQFEMEAYGWLSLGVYKHIVRLYTVERLHGRAVAIGEYVPAGALPNTLRGWIDAGILGFEAALRFGVHICRALEHARSRGLLAHLDLKPENVMITEGGVAKVTDWGLSRLRPRDSAGIPSFANLPFNPPENVRASTGNIRGTPGYTAPELMSPAVEPGPESDMFSLGVTLMEMFDRTRPVPDTPAESLTGPFGWLSAATRSNLADVISACLRASPAARPNSIATVETAIAEAFREATGVPIEPPPRGSWETGADLGQRAFALFNLGRADEATKLQADLFRMYSRQRPEGPAKSGPGEAVTMMDYNEKGWRFIVPEKLVSDAESKLASDPDNLDLLGHAANINHLAGRLNRALSHYSRLLELEPNRIEWLEHTCHILEEEEQWTAALACHDRIIRLSPQNVGRWLNRAECCEKSGDMGKAAESAAKAVAADPSEKARNMYGHYLERLGDFRGALAQFEAALEANPDSALTLYNVGTCWNKLDRPDLAFQNLLTAVEKDPDFAIALNTLGALSMQVRSFQEALVFFERAIGADPRYARPRFNKGQVYEAMQKFEDAREAYLVALEIDPNHELAKKALEQLESRQV